MGVNTIEESIQRYCESACNVIRLIRRDFWPVFIEGDQSYDVLSEVENDCGLHRDHIAEALDHLQFLGFIPGASIEIDEQARQYIQESQSDLSAVIDQPEEIVRSLQSNSLVNLGDIDVIPILKRFFSSMGSLESFSLKNNSDYSLSRRSLPWGVLRTISLFDFDIPQDLSIEDYLMNYIFTSLQAQESLFGESYSDLLLENGGLTVDDKEGLDKLVLSNDLGVIHLTEINRMDQNYGVELRILPGFSPFGLSLLLSLDIGGNKTNFISGLGISFEKRESDRVVAVVHTIQDSPSHIGQDSEGKLLTTEGYHEEGIASIGKKEEKELFKQVAQSLGVPTVNPSQFLVYVGCKYLGEHGYVNVEVINGEENRRLTGHNKTKATGKVNRIIQETYVATGQMFAGQKLSNGRYRITFDGIAAFEHDNEQLMSYGGADGMRESIKSSLIKEK